MNTEISKEAQPAATNNKKSKAQDNRKRRSSGPKRNFRPSVTYSDEELLAIEGQPFWNCSHDAKIKSLSEEGAHVVIAKDGKEIEAFVSADELAPGAAKEAGDVIRVYVEDSLEKKDESEHSFAGSEIKAIELDLLDRAISSNASKEPVEGYIVGTVKGGYCLALFANTRELADSGYGLRAFLPMGRAGLRRDEGLDVSSNGLVKVTIAELDAPRGNIVVSRRELLNAERKQGEESFFNSAEVGDMVEGKVTALMPYGAFVNLGAIDGFLHISDISWDKKPRLKDIVPEGQKIKAKIISIDKETRKVKLSLKDLNPDPWRSIEKTFKPGTEVDGTIVAFADFGAFVKLKDGVEGLIHVGEITWNRIKHPSQHFKIGDEVRAAVLRVDKESRRISLSTKAIEQSPVERLSAQFPIGTIIKTKVESIHDFGFFVELDEESNGLVPRSEISWVRSDDPIEKSFEVGQELEVAVLGYDSQRQRVSCSLKRTQPDPWPQWKQKFRKGSIHKARVLSLQRAGALCQLDGDLSGFCPRSQLEDDANEIGRTRVKVGSDIDVIITACDPLRQRIALSQKQVAESETKEAYKSYLNEQGKGGNERTTLGDAFKNIDLNKGGK